MATFPALEPATRGYNFGLFPLTEEPSVSAGIVRFRHGITPQNYQLTLGYTALTDAEASQIREHFQFQGGGYRSFQLPAIIWAGHTFSGNIVPYTTLWRYTEPPEEEHFSTGYVNVTVALGSDGTIDDELGLQDISVALVAGEAINQPAGFDLTVIASIDNGIIVDNSSAGFEISVPLSLLAGAADPGATSSFNIAPVTLTLTASPVGTSLSIFALNTVTSSATLQLLVAPVDFF